MVTKLKNEEADYSVSYVVESQRYPQGELASFISKEAQNSKQSFASNFTCRAEVITFLEEENLFFVEEIW